MKFKWITLLNLICILFTSQAFAQGMTNFRVGGLQVKKPVKSWQEYKNEGIVKQSLDFSCGAAGVSTILQNYLNDPTSEEEIIQELLEHVDLAKVQARKGFSMLDLKRYLEKKGYKATGYKMDFKFLQQINRPVLVPIKFKNYRHFVIIKGIVGDRVFISDPAVGNMTMKDVKFEHIWLKGIGLVIEREGMSEEDYALAISKQDAVFADYKNISRFLSQGISPTKIYTNEW